VFRLIPVVKFSGPFEYFESILRENNIFRKGGITNETSYSEENVSC
jgi:hypothetical protein